MDKIIWVDKKHSVGHLLIDDQHRTIVDMINKLIDLSKESYSKAEAVRAVVGFSQYADRHFLTEENLLRTLEAPLLKEHRILHQQFSDKISLHLVRCTGRSLDDLVLFLIDWWTDHILVEDMKYKSLLATA